MLAEAPFARAALPPFDNSAMDGYALRAADIAGSGHTTLPVTGRIAAGQGAPPDLAPGTSQQIFTGAPLPGGADAVVMQEHVTREAGRITLVGPVAAGLNVRRRGEDHQKDAAVLAAGQRLGPTRIAILAGVGVAEVTVFRTLRLGLFSTGSELQEPGAPLGAGKIYNTNRVMLRAALADPCIAVRDYGIVADDPGAIRSAIRRACVENDVVLTSGGVSVGGEDHVLDMLRAEDARLDVLKVAIRPGKPLSVGRVQEALFIALPGNPYAAFVTFLKLARPAIAQCTGLTEAEDRWLPGVADFSFPRQPGRREFLPVTWDARDALGRPVLQLLGRGASARLSPVASARGLAEIESSIADVRTGMVLPVEPL